MKIVCLCGSTKFKKDFENVNKSFTLEGHIVLAPGVFAHNDDIILSDTQKYDLDNLHFEKINMSDIVFIINKHGYIGESTKKEIEYAKLKNKEIIYLD